MGPTEIIICVVAAVASLIVGLLVGFVIRKKISEAKIGSAELEAKRIVEEGEKTAETLKKEALIEAKEKIIKEKNEFEKELRERSSLVYAELVKKINFNRTSAKTVAGTS